MSDERLILAVKWEGITDDLLERTAKFPKTARYSISNRIDNAAIDILEGLIDARYRVGRRRREALGEVNHGLSRLRALLRLANRRKYLSDRSYEHVSGRIDEAGRMLGGWIRHIDDGALESRDGPGSRG